VPLGGLTRLQRPTQTPRPTLSSTTHVITSTLNNIDCHASFRPTHPDTDVLTRAATAAGTHHTDNDDDDPKSPPAAADAKTDKVNSAQISLYIGLISFSLVVVMICLVATLLTSARGDPGPSRPRYCFGFLRLHDEAEVANFSEAGAGAQGASALSSADYLPPNYDDLVPIEINHVGSLVGSHVGSHVVSHVGSHVGSHGDSRLGSHVGSHVSSHVGIHGGSHVDSHVGSHGGSHGGSQGVSHVSDIVRTSNRSCHPCGVYSISENQLVSDMSCVFVAPITGASRTPARTPTTPGGRLTPLNGPPLRYSRNTTVSPPGYLQVIRDWAARGIHVNRTLLSSPPPCYSDLTSCHYIHDDVSVDAVCDVKSGSAHNRI